MVLWNHETGKCEEHCKVNRTVYVTSILTQECLLSIFEKTSFSGRQVAFYLADFPSTGYLPSNSDEQKQRVGIP